MNAAAFCRSALTLAMLSTFLAARPAMGSGFALYEQSASGLANAFAGAAAVAEDASTIYWNPAGMSKLRPGKQLVVAGHLINPSTRFTNNGTVGGAGKPLGGEGGDAGSDALVPNAYFAMDLNPDLKFGVGINVPFGLATEYDADWMGRFQGIKAEVESININPSVSWRISDRFSVGAGISWQRFKAELSSAVNFGLAGEGTSVVKGDDDSWGYNAGVLYDLSSSTRLGVAYRSAIKQKVSGTVTFNRPALVPPAAAPDGNVSLILKLPDALSASLAHQLNPRWDLLADMTWTGWSKIQDLFILRDTGATLTTLSLRFKDTMRYSLGANYRYSDAWTWKFGIAFDESPVQNPQFRTVRLPDADRTWFSFGAKCRISNAGAIDFGYTYVMVRDTTINNAQAVAVGTVNGNYKQRVHIVGVQYTHSF